MNPEVNQQVWNVCVRQEKLSSDPAACSSRKILLHAFDL